MLRLDRVETHGAEPTGVKMKLKLLLLCALLWGSLPASAQTIQVGYTLVTATGGTGVPASSALFTYESNGVLVSQAGVPATAPMLSGRILVDEVATETALALVNPSNASASIQFVLRDAAGNQVGQESRDLGPGQHLALFVGQLFGGCERGPARQSDLYQRSGSGSADPAPEFQQPRRAPVCDSPGCRPDDDGRDRFAGFSASRRGRRLHDAVDPRQRDGRRYSGLGSAQTVRRYSLLVRLGAQDVSSFAYFLPPEGVSRVELGDPTAQLVSVGYAVVDPDVGQVSPAGTAVFQLKANEQLVTEAAVAATPLTTKARVFVDTVGTQTGLALANPNSGELEVTLALLDRYGTSQEETTRTLPAEGHFAILATELFSSVTLGFTGQIEVRSPSPIAAVTLKLTTNSRGELVLTTLPVADAVSPPTATSIVFPHIAIGGGFSTRLIFLHADSSNPADGQLQFFQSDGSLLLVPLAGEEGSQLHTVSRPVKLAASFRATPRPSQASRSATRHRTSRQKR